MLAATRPMQFHALSFRNAPYMGERLSYDDDIPRRSSSAHLQAAALSKNSHVATVVHLSF